MRPITKPNAPAVYAEPAATYMLNAVTHPSTTIANLYTFFNSKSWYQVERVKGLNPHQLLIDAKKFYIGRLNDFYPYARRDLIENIGEVCSYCGMPTRDDAHVEHVSPKAWFPARMLLWDNFLLACRDCNSRKSSRPSGELTDTLADFAWPHIDVGGRMVCYTLAKYSKTQDQKNGQVTPVVTEQIAVADLALWMSMDAITISIARGRKVGVELQEVVSGNRYYIAAMVAVSTDKTRKLSDGILKLNNFTSTADVSDRRMTERTQAWIQAVDSVRNLIAVRTAPNTVRDAVAEQILDTIRATGFWLVWVEVFNVQGAGVLEKLELNFFTAFLKTDLPGTDGGRLFF